MSRRMRVRERREREREIAEVSEIEKIWQSAKRVNYRSAWKYPDNRLNSRISQPRSPQHALRSLNYFGTRNSGRKARRNNYRYNCAMRSQLCVCSRHPSYHLCTPTYTYTYIIYIIYNI